MKSFSDGKNSWSISLTVGSIKRVLNDRSVNLSLPYEPDSSGVPLADRIIRDTILFVDVLSSLLSPQAEQLGVSVDEFFELFTPSVLKAAEDCFLEEWKDFFLKAGRETSSKVIAQAQEVLKVQQEQGAKNLQRLAEAQTEAIAKTMESDTNKALADVQNLINGLSSVSVTDTPVASEFPTSTVAP